MKYYNIRVVEADNSDKAFEKIMNADFDETDPICDKVLTLEEFCNQMNMARNEYATDETKLMWWGYKHVSGTYQAKRYFDKRDTDEACESPFVGQVVGPFEAKNRDEAIKIVIEKTK